MPVPMRQHARWSGTADFSPNRHSSHRSLPHLTDGVERARAKLEYAPLATAFCRDDFTVAELRRVYEVVWDTGARSPQFPPQSDRRTQFPGGYGTDHQTRRWPAGATLPPRYGHTTLSAPAPFGKPVNPP